MGKITSLSSVLGSPTLVIPKVIWESNIDTTDPTLTEATWVKLTLGHFAETATESMTFDGRGDFITEESGIYDFFTVLRLRSLALKSGFIRIRVEETVSGNIVQQSRNDFDNTGGANTIVISNFSFKLFLREGINYRILYRYDTDDSLPLTLLIGGNGNSDEERYTKLYIKKWIID